MINVFTEFSEDFFLVVNENDSKRWPDESVWRHEVFQLPEIVLLPVLAARVEVSPDGNVREEFAHSFEWNEESIVKIVI